MKSDVFQSIDDSDKFERLLTMDNYSYILIQLKLVVINSVGCSSGYIGLWSLISAFSVEFSVMKYCSLGQDFRHPKHNTAGNKCHLHCSQFEFLLYWINANWWKISNFMGKMSLAHSDGP